MKSYYRIFTIIVFAAFFNLCSLQKDQPIAKVDDEELTREMIDLVLGDQSDSGVSQDALKDYVNKWIEQELVYQEAKKQKMQLTPYMEEELKRIEKSMLVNMYLKSRIDQIISVSDSEVLKYYEAHPDEFRAEADYFKFIALKTSDRTLANRIEPELINDSDVISIYEKYPGQCEIVSMGKDYLEKTYLLPELAAELRKQKSSKNFFRASINRMNYFVKISSIIEKDNVKEFDLVEEDIKKMILHQKRQEKYSGLIQGLRNNNQSKIIMNIPVDSVEFK
jgi:hypothetical protein